MRKIKAKPITMENFAPYGCFASILKPKGNCLGTFYPDQVLFPVSGYMPVAFSPLASPKPERMIVDSAEYHDLTGEGVLCLNDDVVIHVAPPSKEPVPEKTEAFLVPRGTMVKLNAGVWHLAALPVHEDVAHILIVLPERTYKSDCVVVQYAPEDQIEIEL